MGFGFRVLQLETRNQKLGTFTSPTSPDVESLTNFHKLPNRISTNSRTEFPQTPELHCTNDHYLIKSRHEKIQKKSR